MVTKPNSPRWRFYSLWVVVNSIIMILAEFAAYFVLSGIAIVGTWNSLGTLLGIVQFTFLASAILGAGQWLIMNHYLPKIGLWVVATIGGYCISIPALFYLVVHEVGGAFSEQRLVVSAVVLVGGIVGICQWLVIRHLRYAGWWIVIVIMDLNFSLFIGQLVNTIIPSIGFGFITGWGAIWLSQNQAGSSQS